MSKAFRDLMELAKDQRQQLPLNGPADFPENTLLNASTLARKETADTADGPSSLPRKIQVGKIIFDYWEKTAVSSENLAPPIVAKKGRKILAANQKQSITRLVVSVPDWVASAIEKMSGPGGKGKKLKKLVTQYQRYQEREKKQLAPLKKILDSVMHEKSEYAKKYQASSLYQSKHYRSIDKLVSQAQMAIDLGHILCVEAEIIEQVLGKNYLDEYNFCQYLLSNMNSTSTTYQ